MKEDKLFYRVGKNIYFGSYPQSLVIDQDLKLELVKNLSDIPTKDNPNGFISYKYYILSKQEDYIWYKDIIYNDDKYRCIYFNKYRPSFTNYCCENEKFSKQKANGYPLNHIYFFKFDKIKWNLISLDGSFATIVSELILDVEEYDYHEKRIEIDDKVIFPNNYEYSNIRKWLNESFYDLAFNSLEKEIINKIKIDNSETTTYDFPNRYVCPNTYDNVWLLSYQEVFDTYFSVRKDRIKSSTDYTLSLGSACNKKYNSSCWILRTPYSKMANHVVCVDSYGERCCNISNMIGGVVPVINIKL